MEVRDRIDPVLNVDPVAPKNLSQGLLQRPTAIATVLLALYLLTSLLVDPRGHLLTDVGGKAIGLQAMVERGDWNPDIEYWLAEADPEGVLFPLDKTRLTADGQWVNTTSLTMVYAARALWTVGGLRAALLLPMFGSILAALAAGGIQRRLDQESDGAPSSWVVGLATPAFVYALDFWEHSIALGLLAFAVLKVFDIARSEQVANPALMAGLCFGLAATMRQEAMVYALVSGIVLVSALYRTSGLRRAVVPSALMAAAGSAVLAAYTAAEIAIMGEPFRSSRSVAAASTDISWVRHLRAAATTTVGPLDGDAAMSLVVGGLLVGSVIWVSHLLMTNQESTFAIQCAGVLWVSYFVALVLRGPAFVPGLGTATPLAMVGLVAAIQGKRWFVLALATGPLPLIWLTGYPSGAVLQWGGRYQLLTGLLLTTLAVTLVPKNQPKLLWISGCVAFAMTAFGVSWVSVRSHLVSDQWDTIAAVTSESDVVIWRDTVKAREAGAFAYGKLWLGASHEPEQSLAAELLADAGVSSFVWIDEESGDYEIFSGFKPGEELARLEFFGLRMTRYDRVLGDDLP